MEATINGTEYTLSDKVALSKDKLFCQFHVDNGDWDYFRMGRYVLAGTYYGDWMRVVTIRELPEGSIETFTGRMEYEKLHYPSSLVYGYKDEPEKSGAETFKEASILFPEFSFRLNGEDISNGDHRLRDIIQCETNKP